MGETAGPYFTLRWLVLPALERESLTDAAQGTSTEDEVIERLEAESVATAIGALRDDQRGGDRCAGPEHVQQHAAGGHQYRYRSDARRRR
jgi:hypothetical protein